MHTKQNTLTFMQRIKDSALEIKSVKLFMWLCHVNGFTCGYFFCQDRYQ